ncbi:uncharacterized protein BX663DRAFT_517796 [Cokeromyces recurvatus]|uniref:uncharacterized protein n=1 Tax=Cokeromyces recurvatus TaxID=90255 RepID=UPI00221FF0D8|nr:uncharacterized protein BX663DRAFT_517796 [Cokeromyces recurvatus]KAI7900479.1 hypothetical protein BX663DRAFT_517796 [Cokeromyces recurvatus]
MNYFYFFIAFSSTSPICKSDDVTIYNHCNRPGVVVLTFDDGPDIYTYQAAKYIYEKGAIFTFFTNGNIFV